MGRKRENCAFVCENCGTRVEPVTNGGYRNHCPACLYSKHVDIHPGDRLNPCRGLMRPIGLAYKSKKGYQIVHECLRCGARRVNRVAVDTVQPDDLVGWLRTLHGGTCCDGFYRELRKECNSTKGNPFVKDKHS